MTDYLNEFTPDWPHGYVAVFSDGTAMPFVVKVTDAPGEFPIWGYAAEGSGGPWIFRADGSSSAYAPHLRNVAPPAPKPREWWVNIYQGGTPGVAYATREIADDRRRENRLECIRVREVIEETEAEPEEKLPHDFNLAHAKAALDDPYRIQHALTWASTPQGYCFWFDYLNQTLSPEGMAVAREALRRWIAIAEREVTP